jgi:hypothetical protein
MGRLREALAVAAPPSEGRCRLIQFVDDLPDDDRDEMLELLADRQVRDWEIRNLCRSQWQFDPSESLIYRHRRARQGCACG